MVERALSNWITLLALVFFFQSQAVADYPGLLSGTKTIRDGGMVSFESDLVLGVYGRRSNLIYRRGELETFYPRRHKHDSIIDLGENQFSDLVSLPSRVSPPLRQTRAERLKTRKVKAIVGHLYLLHVDSDARQFEVLFRVLKAGVECEIEWLRFDRNDPLKRPKLSKETALRLERLLLNVRGRYSPSLYLKEPKVNFQLLSGNRNGQSIVCMDLSRESVPEVSTSPMLLDFKPHERKKTIGYISAGLIPEDQSFVVRKVVYKGLPGVDGKTVLVLNGERLFDFGDTTELINDSWHGERIVEPREENAVCLEAAGKAMVDVAIEGEFVSIERKPRALPLKVSGLRSGTAEYIGSFSSISFESDLAYRSTLSYRPGSMTFTVGRRGRGVIIDLGEKSFEDLEELPALGPDDSDSAKLKKGHLYLARYKGGALDFFSIFRVSRFFMTKYKEGMEIEWVRLDRDVSPKPQLSEQAAKKLLELLKARVPKKTLGPA